MIRHYIVKLKLLPDVCFIFEELGGVHLDSFTFLIHHSVIPNNPVGSVDVLHLLAEILNRVLQRLLSLYKVFCSLTQESFNMVKLFGILL